MSGKITDTITGALSQYNMGRPVPVEKDNRFELADKSYPELSDSEVFLSETGEKVTEEFCKSLQKRDLLLELGIPINPSLLLYGKPGTGKTKLANNIAARLALPLVTARADALISSYLGSTSKNIRSLLDYAKSEPCVLFLDEFDAIAKARDDKNEIGELKRVVVSLLQNIDSLGDTILIAATNHLHLLDPAIGRRFHYKLELYPPKLRERRLILAALFRKIKVDDKDIELCAEASEGMTGAEIEMATHNYLRYTVINDVVPNCVGLLKELLINRYPWLTFNNDEAKHEDIQKLKSINPDFYTGTLLSKLWNISPSYVSRILKESK